MPAPAGEEITAVRRAAVKLVLLIALLLGADQLTKLIIRRTMEPYSSVEVLPFLHLQYVRNRGIAFGLLEGHAAAIIFTSSLVVLVLVVAALVVRGRGRWTWPFALLVAGSIGNLLDRVVLGSVTDFISIPHWPAFNLADVFIVIGVLLLVKSLILQVEQVDREDEDAWEEKEGLSWRGEGRGSGGRARDGEEGKGRSGVARTEALRP